ncbi:DUF1972 domain-containing protein [Oceanispirochaeta crateris]|uniref:DUF1972 domain-containing protein n=1 Tax=Oceanispirochaeta crateris TaxID=2518645 RepID=A0A5C1QHI9_9SPIO|nr:DUF1972 domain-containing protein [Oceanispirochaeta crateris]QEN06977.1 DUF1972 domain-containing protein [Oceanispirochaeta crateris]
MIYVSVIGIVGVPACYGGFESLVENLLDYIPFNVEYTIFCSKKNYSKTTQIYKGAKLKYINIKANGIWSILYDWISIIRSRNSDVLLILGVSGCSILPLVRIFYKGKIITNIDGLEWKRAKWKRMAKYFLHYSEKIAVKYSDVIIGDNAGITDYIDSKYKVSSKLIEYGSNHAKQNNSSEFAKEYLFCEKPYALTVCRIEPENNISDIIKAFESGGNPYPLVIVGNWNNSKYARELYLKYSSFNNIKLLSPIYDINRINFIRCHATVYIHGHSAGGTNPSLVEAMNLGLPVLAYDCIYNRNTTENEALYWRDSEELNKLLFEDLTKIALRMKEISNRRYKWEFIAKKYNKLFNF